MNNYFRKGKKNKVKVGQKVKASQHMVDWHASHLSWSYGKLPIDPAVYDANQREIHVKDLEDVLFWSAAKVYKKLPTGVALYFGASDNNDGIDRNCVKVRFTIKLGKKMIRHETYVDETKDLQLNKRRKK